MDGRMGRTDKASLRVACWQLKKLSKIPILWRFTAFYGIFKKFWSKRIFVLVWSDKVSLPEAQTTRHYDREFFLTYESLPRGVRDCPRFPLIIYNKNVFEASKPWSFLRLTSIFASYIFLCRLSAPWILCHVWLRVVFTMTYMNYQNSRGKIWPGGWVFTFNPKPLSNRFMACFAARFVE